MEPDASLESRDRSRGNGQQLQHRKLCQNIRKLFLTVGVTGPWHRLPRDFTIESHSLKILKSYLDLVLGNWHYVTLLGQGSWTR